MPRTCGTCVCSAPAQTLPTTARTLLLATRVDHTARALRASARRSGTEVRVRAPGLLELHGPDLDAFLSRALAELSVVEAAEVRCLVLDGAPAADRAGARTELLTEGPARGDGARTGDDLLAAALLAPSLAEAGARVGSRALLPLFDDEERCFRSVYQPIVRLADRLTVGHEALLRAELPDGSPVMPDELFPAADAAGWTNLLDRVGRTTALRGAGGWLGDDLLFINFVPTSIYRPEVCLRTTEQAAERAGVRLDQIVFEVTEGHRVHDLDHLERVFAYYRSRSCLVALDDLGAGWSSLNTLVRLQPDVVKLDKDLVQALPGAVASAVVEAVVTITHAYGGRVLAECVETEEQAAAALDLGVDLGQGWLFGRPVRRDRPAGHDLSVPAQARRQQLR